MNAAHVFGDRVTAAQIFAPDRVPAADSRLAPHCLATVDASFPERVAAGDFVVAGREFGCGVYRGNAAPALAETGVGAVLAESFARLFLRDAIGIGLPVVEVPGVTAHVADGDLLTIDPRAGVLHNETTDVTRPLGSYPAFVEWSLRSTRRRTARREGHPAVDRGTTPSGQHDGAGSGTDGPGPADPFADGSVRKRPGPDGTAERSESD